MADSKSLVIQAGVTKQIPDADSLLVGAGVKSVSGTNLTLTSGSTSIILATALLFNANIGLTATAGTGAFDFSGGTGLFKTSTGAVTIGGGSGAIGIDAAAAITIGGTSATSVSVGRAGVTTTIPGTLDVAVIDRAGTIDIGGTSGTTITIGRSGQLTTIAGNLGVTGTEVVTGGTTFNGAVILGDAEADDITFNGSIVGSFRFKKEAAHTIDVFPSTTLSTAGGALTYTAGAGSAGSGVTAGAAGGAVTLRGATGGAGVAGAASGGGGAAVVDGGAAGADGGGGVGANGAVQIGQTNAVSIAIGRSGITTTITGRLDQLTGALNLTANAASQLTTSSGALTITGAASSTWSTTGTLTVNGTTGVLVQYNGKTALSAGVSGNPSATGAYTGAKAILASGTATLTIWGTPAAGEVGYMTSTSGTAAKALATALGTSRFAGVYDGTANELVTGDVVGMLFDSGLTSLTAGDAVYISAATAGRVTKTAPSTAGQVVAVVGTLVDSANYNNTTGSVHAVRVQVETPILL